MTLAKNNPPVAIVIDSDRARIKALAERLIGWRVIMVAALHDAFSLIEELHPEAIAIASGPAADDGCDMLMRLATAIGARRVVYGSAPPPELAPGTPWVALADPADNPRLAAVIAGHAQAPAIRVMPDRRPDLIVIGASTGGVTAIETVLSHFTATCPPTLIVQHIRPSFVDSMLDRLDRSQVPRVVAAVDGVLPRTGTVYVAATPECHLTLTDSPRPRLRITPAPPDCLHRPGIDALFHSAAAQGPRVAAALLTGMGADGAQGLAAIRAAGGYTIAQDHATSIVYGMPRVAAELGAAAAILPLDRIGPALLAGAQGAARTLQRATR